MGTNAVLGIVLYLVVNLALIPLFPRLNPSHQGALAITLAIVDLLFVSFIIYHTGGLISQYFLLYCLLVFKAAIYYPYVHAIFLVPFLIFPLYIATLFLDTGTLVFLTDQLFVPRYISLFAVILTGLYTAWHLDSRHQHTRELLEQLESEHRHTDARRRELRAVLDSIGDGVIVVDGDLGLLMINPIAAQVFGLQHPLPEDGPSSDLLDNSVLLNLLHRTLEDTDSQVSQISDEIEILQPGSGKPVVFQALGTALIGEMSARQGVVVVLRDMTKQRALDESKTNFISVLSHELRTPLTAIRGFVDLILSNDAGEINQEQREYLDIVSEQSEHLEGLINALLEFAELDASDISLNKDLVSLENLTNAALAQVEALAQKRSITLHPQVPSDLPLLYADGPRLERVLYNLLHNAVKFTPRNGLVTVSVEDHESEVHICITDTGRGVPVPERELIFDRFYQIDSSSTREYGGTGLGLALCKHVVEMHQGRIWVEQPDTNDRSYPGSRFCFTIPRESPPPGVINESSLDAEKDAA
jgi:two-component system phosphate regulon sensor histidine kinase PhoR